MKILFFGLALLTSISSFAMVCGIGLPSGDVNTHDRRVALYHDVEKSNSTMMTLIKPNGEVLENFSTETYFEGVASQAEIEARKKEIVGSKLASVGVDEQGRLILAIGTIQDSTEELFKSNAMMMGTTDRLQVLFDMENKISITCNKTPVTDL